MVMSPEQRWLGHVHDPTRAEWVIFILRAVPRLLVGMAFGALAPGSTPVSQIAHRPVGGRAALRRRGFTVRARYATTLGHIASHSYSEVDIVVKRRAVLLKDIFFSSIDLATDVYPVAFLDPTESSSPWMEISTPDGSRYISSSLSNLSLVAVACGWAYVSPPGISRPVA